MRKIPVELFTRYEAAGWWTRESPGGFEVAEYPRTASG
jgi:hypothetical protein